MCTQMKLNLPKNCLSTRDMLMIIYKLQINFCYAFLSNLCKLMRFDH